MMIKINIKRKGKMKQKTLSEKILKGKERKEVRGKLLLEVKDVKQFIKEILEIIDTHVSIETSRKLVKQIIKQKAGKELIE